MVNWALVLFTKMMLSDVSLLLRQCCYAAGWPGANFVARLVFALTGELTYPVAAGAIAEALLCSYEKPAS